MQFNALISNILSIFFKIRKNKWRTRAFESYFWPILTVFIILCRVQPPGRYSQMIKANFRLFTSCWCIKKWCYFNVFANDPLHLEIFICLADTMHSGKPGRYNQSELFINGSGVDVQKFLGRPWPGGRHLKGATPGTHDWKRRHSWPNTFPPGTKRW